MAHDSDAKVKVKVTVGVENGTRGIYEREEKGVRRRQERVWSDVDRAVVINSV
jgi:hypothetical protein